MLLKKWPTGEETKLRRYWWVALALMLVAAIYATFMFTASAQQKALRYIQKGKYDTAISMLGKVKEPSIDVQATRLLMLSGLIGADGHMQHEFDGISNVIIGVQEPSEAIEQLRTDNYKRMAKHRDLFQVLADDFAQKYKRGTPIKTPWQRGRMRLNDNDRRVNSAWESLQSGNLHSKNIATIENALYRIGIYGVFQLSLQQEDTLNIALSGEYYTPLLLFIIGARVEDPLLKTWYMSEVLAIAPPDHEVALMAQEYLANY